MSDVLPLVVKAQPATATNETAMDFFKDIQSGKVKYFRITDIERERLGWEQREKVILEKITKTESRCIKLFALAENNLAYSGNTSEELRQQLYEIALKVGKELRELKEPLGLSKQ